MTSIYKNFGKALLLGFASLLSPSAADAQVTVQTFTYTGSIGTFTVPPCVTTITMDVRGAQGGFGNGGSGGNGARMVGVFTVTPGQVLRYLVGQSPGNISTGGYTFPAGGGGSYVANGASIATSTPMIVAGGGGGGYGTTGDAAPITTSGTGGLPGTGGNGAPASSCGGGGGGFYTSGAADINYGFPGGQGFQQGGNGGWSTPTYTSTYQPGGFGGGTSANYVGSCNLQGGNGGGYSGGSGYGTAVYGAGTAGGSFNAGTSQSNTAGFNSGHGTITFSYTAGSVISAVANPTATCAGNTATLLANNVSTYTWFPMNTPSQSVTVNPTSTTIYTVVGTNLAGCTSTALVTLTVNASVPSLSVTATSNTVCLGQSMVLNAAGALTYTWSNNVTNNVSFTPSVTNVFTVTGGNGCGTVTATQAITVAPIAVAVSANTTTICNGASTTATANAAATSFSWFPTTQTGSTTILAPSSNIIYTIAVSNGTCGGTQTLAVNVLTTPTISSVGSNSTICVGQSVTLTATGAGTNGTYTWAPSGGNQSTAIVTPTAATVYTVIGTNSLNCSSASQTFVIVNLGPNLNVTASKTLACNGQSVTLTASGAGTYAWASGPNTAAYVVTAGNGATPYQVVGTHTVNICTTTKTINVTGITPTVIVTPSIAICTGATATLNASGATSYTWVGLGTGSVVTTSPTSNTTYTIVANTQSLNAASQAVNCSVTATEFVKVNPNPTVSVAPTRPQICKNETNTLTASGAVTYVWSNNATTASVVVNPTLSTNYTVTGTDANGCSSFTVYLAKVNTCNGIAENTVNTVVSVFPNPANSAFTVSSDKSLTLQMVNSIGQVVRIIKVDAGSTTSVETSELSAGVYFLLGNDGSQKISTKVIISK